MGFIPKFFWGRRNPNYTGPSRAAGITGTVTGDAMQIARDFAHVVQAAEDAEYAGDTAAAEELRLQAARIYATHRYFSHLVESIPDRRRDLDRWEQSYADLRKASGLDRRAQGPVTPDAGDYAGARISDQDRQEVADAIRGRSDGGTDATRAAYAEATGRAETPPASDGSERGREDSGRTTFSDEPPADEPPPPGDADAPPPDDEDLPPDFEDIRPENDEATPHEPRPTRRTRSKGKRVSAGPGRPMKERGPLTALEQATGLDKYGSTRVTWRPRYGPFIMNMGRNGPVSLSLAMGPMRYRLWSRRHKRGLSSIDLPGGMSFRGRQVSRDKRK